MLLQSTARSFLFLGLRYREVSMPDHAGDDMYSVVVACECVTYLVLTKRHGVQTKLDPLTCLHLTTSARKAGAATY